MAANTAEIEKCRREQKPRPVTANERDGRKRSRRNSGKALQKKVVRQRGDRCGGDGDGGGRWLRVIGAEIVGLEAGFGGDRDSGR